jgi:hypothetical protein
MTASKGFSNLPMKGKTGQDFTLSPSSAMLEALTQGDKEKLEFDSTSLGAGAEMADDEREAAGAEKESSVGPFPYGMSEPLAQELLHVFMQKAKTGRIGDVHFNLAAGALALADLCSANRDNLFYSQFCVNEAQISFIRDKLKANYNVGGLAADR